MNNARKENEQVNKITKGWLYRKLLLTTTPRSNRPLWRDQITRPRLQLAVTNIVHLEPPRSNHLLVQTNYQFCRSHLAQNKYIHPSTQATKDIVISKVSNQVSVNAHCKFDASTFILISTKSAEIISTGQQVLLGKITWLATNIKTGMVCLQIPIPLFWKVFSLLKQINVVEKSLSQLLVATRRQSRLQKKLIFN